jgi:DNA repair protein SbcD/Mre11
MLKILHTSDWHIGKQLHKVELEHDLGLFFDWLHTVIQSESIDVVLMSGDLFDQANPSQNALRQYYRFLKRIVSLNCKLIITGGNHDSPSVLNAPKDVLDLLDVSIVGGAPESIHELFIPIEKKGEKIVVAAVPFLRDRDVRKSAPGESYADKIVQLKAGLKHYFKALNAYFSENYSDWNYIVMAHLYAQGASVSESERDIQIGNQAGVDASIFGSEPDYVALGHIHRPQRVGADHVRYSGSPISLSFSERSDQKQVVIITVNNHELSVHSLHIPVFRKLVLFEGTLDEVTEKIETYSSDSLLTDLGEVLIREPKESQSAIRRLEQILSSDIHESIQLVKGKIEFADTVKGLGNSLSSGESIHNYSPLQLFEMRMNEEGELNNREDLLLAFREVLDHVNRNQSNELL